MKYIRGTVLVKTQDYNAMKKFFKREVYTAGCKKTIEFYDGRIEVEIYTDDRRLILEIVIFNKHGRIIEKYKNYHSKVSTLFGLKKIISGNKIFLIEISKKDYLLKTEISNLHLLSWECKNDDIFLEDFINFFDVEDNVNIMKLIFCTLTKIDEVYDYSLQELIDSKLDYYGYGEELYKKFSYDSEEASSIEDTSAKMLEQCLSVLYYHIYNNEVNDSNISEFKTFIYEKYEQYLNKLQEEGALA